LSSPRRRFSIMASNREERLQMRQRGAGTRKIKEVNFGFAFGLAPPPEEPPQAASQPVDVDIPTEPLAAPQPPSASEIRNLLCYRQKSSFHHHHKIVDSSELRAGRVISSPSDHQHLTYRKMMRWTLDEAASEERLLPSQSPRVSVEPEVTQQDKRDSPVLQNGVHTSAPVSSKPTEPRDEPPSMQTTTDTPQTEQAPQEALDLTTAMVSDTPAAEAPIPEDERSDQNNMNQKSTEPPNESSGADGTPALGATTNGKRKRRGPSADQRRSQSIERPETETETTQQPAPQELSLETNRDKSMEADSPNSQPGRRSRGRPRTSAQSSPATNEGSAQNEAASTEIMPGESIPTQQQTTKRPRGRKAKEPTEDSAASETQNGQPMDEGTVAEEDDMASSERSRQLRQKSKETNHTQRQVGRPGKKALQSLESVEAPGPAGEKRKQRKRLESEPEPEVETEGSKEPKPAGEKRKRGRRSKEESEPEPELQPQSEPQNESEVPKEPKPAVEMRKRRKRPDQEQEQEQEVEPEVEPEPEVSRESESAPEKRKRGRRARGEQELEPEPERQPEAPEEPGPATEKRKRRGRSYQEPEQEPEPETQAELDPGSSKEAKSAGEKRKRGRRSKEEREPEPEPEGQTEAPEEPEPAPAPKRGRGRPSLSNKGPEVTQREEDPEAQNESGEAASRTTRRKPRQPRGETVPVTVHRLANVASLGGDVQPSEESDEEEESADELSTRQKTKLPSRGGVNVADVLSQICRETLEKTLTTLTNGISNEGNAARRSEWTTKKKAVEAFGTELEGRLFELSEMLDSNFVLGVKLKKAKRDMMDMRSRLYQLRKEREVVALQMDAVRRKHTEEENASLARTNINNSLHSLDLALERSQNRPAGDSAEPGSSEPSLTVGLEFMLRSVADNVSSRALERKGVS
ncbi:putative triadin, partial [Aspergillus nomiae NRRL 13137]